jgi:hypothetical protein
MRGRARRELRYLQCSPEELTDSCLPNQLHASAFEAHYCVDDEAIDNAIEVVRIDALGIPSDEFEQFKTISDGFHESS